jgi:hypothetical protein
MTVAAFDTLKFANKLKQAGVPDKQAEAEAEALAEALAVNLADLATADDLQRIAAELRADLRTDIQKVSAQVEKLEERTSGRTSGRFTLLQWMLGFNLALTVAALWFLFRLLTSP